MKTINVETFSAVLFILHMNQFFCLRYNSSSVSNVKGQTKGFESSNYLKACESNVLHWSL